VEGTLKALRPVPVPRAYLDKLEEAVRRAFRRWLYQPLMREIALPEDVLENSLSALLYAIRRGFLRYQAGRFQGRLNAEISGELKQLGAAWDPETKSFRIAEHMLPPEMRAAIQVAERVFAKRLEGLEVLLGKKGSEEITRTLRLEPILDAALWKVDGDLVKTLGSLTVTPVLTAEQRRRLAEEWEQDLKRGIKDFTAEEILKLRQDIKAAVLAGNRYEGVVKAIQHSYRVSANKAKFLARQETNLMVSKYKETRYAEAGVYEYRWRCVVGSPLHPVRPAHKALDGKVFRFDNPPVTTEPGEPQRRNNPGEDFNCRCQGVPLARFKGAT
jgi:SPP1 gp7 family putative phage head morphogenesis protein